MLTESELKGKVEEAVLANQHKLYNVLEQYDVEFPESRTVTSGLLVLPNIFIARKDPKGIAGAFMLYGPSAERYEPIEALELNHDKKTAKLDVKKLEYLKNEILEYRTPQDPYNSLSKLDFGLNGILELGLERESGFAVRYNKSTNKLFGNETLRVPSQGNQYFKVYPESSVGGKENEGFEPRKIDDELLWDLYVGINSGKF